jgi:hypothetical protein
MKTEEQKIILVELLQKSLAGQIDPSSNFNPNFLAEAIISKLALNQTFEEKNAKKVEEAVKSFNEMINVIDDEMTTELQQLGKDEVLLKNFVRGQKTTCEKLRETLKTI